MGVTLVRGNLRYSSWTVRAWLALKLTGEPFECVDVPLFSQQGDALLREYSPTALVPVLHDGEIVVWDTLAICEYLAEGYPDLPLWPQPKALRSLARSACAQMHSGFSKLRSAMPMNTSARFALPLLRDVADEVERMQQLWSYCFAQRESGDFLLGDNFGLVDAYFAPIVSRFTSYGVPAATGQEQEYRDALMQAPLVLEWYREAAMQTEELSRYHFSDAQE